MLQCLQIGSCTIPNENRCLLRGLKPRRNLVWCTAALPDNFENTLFDGTWYLALSLCLNVTGDFSSRRFGSRLFQSLTVWSINDFKNLVVLAKGTVRRVGFVITILSCLRERERERERERDGKV